MSEHGQIGRYNRQRAEEDAAYCGQVVDAIRTFQRTKGLAALPPVAAHLASSVLTSQQITNLDALLIEPYVTSRESGISPDIQHRICIGAASVARYRSLVVGALTKFHSFRGYVWELVSGKAALADRERSPLWTTIRDAVSGSEESTRAYIEFCRRCVDRACAEGYFNRCLVENLLSGYGEYWYIYMRHDIAAAERSFNHGRVVDEDRFNADFWYMMAFVPPDKGYALNTTGGDEMSSGEQDQAACQFLAELNDDAMVEFVAGETRLPTIVRRGEPEHVRLFKQRVAAARLRMQEEQEAGANRKAREAQTRIVDARRRAQAPVEALTDDLSGWGMDDEEEDWGDAVQLGHGGIDD